MRNYPRYGFKDTADVLKYSGSATEAAVIDPWNDDGDGGVAGGGGGGGGGGVRTWLKGDPWSPADRDGGCTGWRPSSDTAKLPMEGCVEEGVYKES